VHHHHYRQVQGSAGGKHHGVRANDALTCLHRVDRLPAVTDAETRRLGTHPISRGQCASASGSENGLGSLASWA
jgi:hypothetical protein